MTPYPTLIDCQPLMQPVKQIHVHLSFIQHQKSLTWLCFSQFKLNSYPLRRFYTQCLYLVQARLGYRSRTCYLTAYEAGMIIPFHSPEVLIRYNTNIYLSMFLFFLLLFLYYTQLLMVLIVYIHYLLNNYLQHIVIQILVSYHL